MKKRISCTVVSSVPLDFSGQFTEKRQMPKVRSQRCDTTELAVTDDDRESFPTGIFVDVII